MKESDKIMFAENDRVRIKGKKVIGEIIDIHKSKDGTVCYTVESEQEGPVNDPDAWNDVRFPQFICTEDQLEYM